MTTNPNTCEKFWRLLFADHCARYYEQQCPIVRFRVVKWITVEYGDVVTLTGGGMWSGESTSHPFLLLRKGRRILSDSLKTKFDADMVTLELVFDLEANRLMILEDGAPNGNGYSFSHILSSH